MPRPNLLFCSCSRPAEPPETGSSRPSGAGPPGPEGFPLVNARVVDRGGVVQAAGNSSRVTGGAWPRAVGNGSDGNPRCSSIFFATSGSSMQAIIRIGPRQREHFRTSTEREPFGPRQRPAKAARPNRGDTSTAPTSTSAMTGAATGAVTSSTPAARRVVQRHQWSTVAGGRPCRARGSSARRRRAVHSFITWR